MERAHGIDALATILARLLIEQTFVDIFRARRRIGETQRAVQRVVLRTGSRRARIQRHRTRLSGERRQTRANESSRHARTDAMILTGL